MKFPQIFTLFAFSTAYATPLSQKEISHFSSKHFGNGTIQQENLHYALLTLQKFPWTAQTPPEIFLNNILPPSHLDEPLTSWRPQLYQLCAPLVKNAKSRHDAILAISQKFPPLSHVKYSTTRRAPNQTCHETLQSKIASCSGLSILLASAYRSVGIPARIVGVAAWSDRPGNHTWIEVWDNNSWHATEFYPDPNGPNHGWFYDPISKLQPNSPEHHIIARTITGGNTTFHLPWNPNNQSLPGINRTTAYQQRAQQLIPKTSSTQFLILEAKNPQHQRIPIPFRWLQNQQLITSGTTPSSTDDLNAAPRLPRNPQQTYQLQWQDPQGNSHTETISPKSPPNLILHIP